MYSASDTRPPTSSYKESSEAELLDAASPSAVAAESLLVSRLAIKLRQSAQKGNVVVTGPRHCLVLSCSQCAWMANNMMKVTAPHQNPPKNRKMYIVFIHVSSTSRGSSVTLKSIKLMLYIMMPLDDWGVQISINTWYILEGWWQCPRPAFGEKQNYHSFTAPECGLFMFQATTMVLIICPIQLPSLTLVPLLRVYKCLILLSSICLLALSCQY